MFLHQSANLDENLYHACDLWHMHQDWKIEHWEEKYIYTHTQVAHLRFRISALPHCYQVEQVAFQVDMVLVLVSALWVALVEVHLCLCVSGVFGDSVLCHFCKEGSRLSDFPKHSRVSFHRSLHIFVPRQLNSRFFPSRTYAWGFLIRNCISSNAPHENLPLAISTIFKARRMSDCSSCTRPPCLAIVADMFKTYQKLVAASTY